MQLYSVLCRAIEDGGSIPAIFFIASGIAAFILLIYFTIMNREVLFLQPKSLMVTCFFSEQGEDIRQIVRSSFTLFLKNALACLEGGDS